MSVTCVQYHRNGEAINCKEKENLYHQDLYLFNTTIVKHHLQNTARQYKLSKDNGKRCLFVPMDILKSYGFIVESSVFSVSGNKVTANKSDIYI